MSRSLTRLLALGIMAAAVSFPSVVNAQDEFRALHERFLFHEIGVNARTAAMGGAYSALQGGDMGLLGNPASLGFLEDRYIGLDFSQQDVTEDGQVSGGFSDPGFSVSEFESEMFTVGGGVAYPFEWGGLSVYYNYRDDDIDSSNALFPSGNARQQPADLERHTISAAGGYRIQDVWAVGYRYSYIDIDFDQELRLARPLPGFTDGSFSTDIEGHNNQIGAQYLYSDNITFGLLGSFGFGDRDNIGSGDSDNESWSVRGGTAIQPLADHPLLVALDLSYSSFELDLSSADVEDDIFGVHLGFEYEALENLFIRAGYQFEDFDFEAAGVDEETELHSITAGFGYIYNQVTFDYGFRWSNTNDGDVANFVSVGYKF